MLRILNDLQFLRHHCQFQYLRDEDRFLPMITKYQLKAILSICCRYRGIWMHRNDLHASNEPLIPVSHEGITENMIVLSVRASNKVMMRLSLKAASLVVMMSSMSLFIMSTSWIPASMWRCKVDMSKDWLSMKENNNLREHSSRLCRCHLWRRFLFHPKVLFLICPLIKEICWLKKIPELIPEIKSKSYHYASHVSFLSSFDSCYWYSLFFFSLTFNLNLFLPISPL